MSRTQNIVTIFDIYLETCRLPGTIGNARLGVMRLISNWRSSDTDQIPHQGFPVRHILPTDNTA